MKAIAYTKYGPPDVLQLRDVEKPFPKDNEVLVQIHASSVNAFEWRRFSLPPVFIRLMGGGLRKPKDTKIGADLAGRVEAVGAKVTQFRPGDEVFGIRRGAFGQYVCAPENLLAPKPTNVSFEAAASYSCGLRHRHERFKNDAIQTSKERNNLLPWRRRAHEVPAEAAVNDFIPDSHHPLTPLDFVAGQFRNAFEKWTGQHDVGAAQFKQPMG